MTKKNKYRNKKCKMIFENQSYTFDSKMEMTFFSKLGHRLKRFEIEKLKLQPQFLLHERFTINTDRTKTGKSNIQAMIYTPDFSYIENGKVIVVEVKGVADTAFNIRKRIFLAQLEEHGVDEYHLVFKNEIIKYWR